MLQHTALLFRSTLFYVGYYLATLIISVACMVLFWFLPLRRRFWLYALWCGFILFWLRVTCAIRYDIRGNENVPGLPVVVLSNHQSEWETIFLYYHFSPVCPILKKELLSIPFWGWAMRLQRPIAIDRSRPREASKSLLTQGAARVKDGLSIVIFPEGTRSAPGQLKKLSRGGAQLAIASGTAALPVAHNAGVCWPRQFIKKPGLISVRIGKPLSVEGKNSRELTDEYGVWLRESIEAIGGAGLD